MGRRISKEFLHPSILESVNDKIGNLDSLETDAKGNMVQAINELADKIDTEIAEGKELIANAVGEPLTAEESFDEMSNDINGLLSTFKTNMMNNGVTVESGDKFKALIDKIATLADNEGKGIQFAEGTVNFNSITTGNANKVYMNLNFTPTYVIGVIDHFTVGQTGNSVNMVMGNFGTSGHQYAERAVINNVSSSEFDFTVQYGIEYTTSNVTVTWYAIGVGEEDTTLRDSLASILEEEGVSVTEEDDMASLISKVDEEFDRQVVPAGDAVADNVLSGKTFINSTGQLVTGTMVDRGGAQTVTPGTSNKTLNSGYYSGNITVQGDSNLVASNIVSGKSIFGVTGTATTLSVGNIVKSSVAGSSSVTFTTDEWVTYSISYSGLSKKPTFAIGVINCTLDPYSLEYSVNSVKNYSESTCATIEITNGSFDSYITNVTNYGLVLHFRYRNSSSNQRTMSFYTYCYLFE